MVIVKAREDAVGDPAPRALIKRRMPIRRHVPALLLLISLGVWWFAIELMRGETAGQYGLLATTGGHFLLAGALVALVAFVCALAVDSTLYAVLAIVVVTVIGRVTATVLTDVPIYVWTYKHVGIVDFMIEDHFSPHVQIYGDWPGFFSGMAWFSTVSGLHPLTVAHWFAPIATAVIALLVGVLVLSAGFAKRAALIAAMLAVILNWTGQDYYSPQAAGLVLALSILSLLLYSKKAPLAGHLSTPVFAVLVATHQLTPFWLFIVEVGFVVFNQMRPRWLPLLHGVILALYVVPRLARTATFNFFSGFNPVKNSTVVTEGKGSSGRDFTVLLERGLFVGLWLLAAVCFVVIWRRYGAPWGLAIMAFSSVLILAGQDYGGEGIIRVYLYSIAGCAILVAVVVARIFELENSWRKTVGCIVATAFILAVGAIGLQGYYGGWGYYTVSKSQVELSRDLPASSDGQFVIGNIAQPVGWPEGATAASVRLKLVDPAYDAVLNAVRPGLLHKDLATSWDVDRLETTLPKMGRAHTLYLILPRQADAYGQYLGWFPPTYIPSLIEQLTQRPNWSKIVDDEDTVIFEYSPKKR
jgi:hypothetical protein